MGNYMGNYEELKQEIEEMLQKVTLLPVREYAPETVLAIGAVGLDMNSYIAGIFERKQEYRDAPVYINQGKKTDVEESMADYSEYWRTILRRLENCCRMLRREMEIDRTEREAVLEFIAVYSRLVEELAASLMLPEGTVEMLEYADEYQKRVELLYDVTVQYCRLHLGDSSYLN